jgi:hypothetical protein
MKWWFFQRRPEEKVAAPIKPDGNTEQLERVREKTRAYRSRTMRQERSSIERFVLEMQRAGNGKLHQN